MARYEVTWGDDSATVYADTEQGAWTEFVRGNDLAMRHPQLRERTIEVVDENEESNPEQ